MDYSRPKHYAVIFSHQRTDGDHGYADMAAQMEALAKTMPGYLEFESARNKDGSGITVSYWETEAAILNWKKNAEHLQAQSKGRAEWYEIIRCALQRLNALMLWIDQGRRLNAYD